MAYRHSAEEQSTSTLKKCKRHAKVSLGRACVLRQTQYRHSAATVVRCVDDDLWVNFAGGIEIESGTTHWPSVPIRADMAVSTWQVALTTDSEAHPLSHSQAASACGDFPSS